MGLSRRRSISFISACRRWSSRSATAPIGSTHPLPSHSQVGFEVHRSTSCQQRPGQEDQWHSAEVQRSHYPSHSRTAATDLERHQLTAMELLPLGGNLITHKVTSYRPAELGANGKIGDASFSSHISIQWQNFPNWCIEYWCTFGARPR